jgi:hypothetical protein
MKWIEHNMASHTVLAWPQSESTAQFWLEIVRASARSTPRNPLTRWTHWLRFRWKPVVLSISFWAVYGYVCTVWLTS